MKMSVTDMTYQNVIIKKDTTQEHKRKIDFVPSKTKKAKMNASCEKINLDSEDEDDLVIKLNQIKGILLCKDMLKSIKLET